LLGRREYSVSKLREKLQKLFPEKSEEFSSLIEEFIERDWVSDTRFSEAFIRDQIIKKNGPQKIKQKLRQQGIDDDLITTCLLSVYSRDEQLQLAETWGHKKFEELTRRRPQDSEMVRQQKVKNFLVGRGFDFDVVVEVGQNLKV
jgi:regulatory protein